MSPFEGEIHKIKKQIIDKYQPVELILFGSCAKGRVTNNSDIDICVILDTVDKRQKLREMLIEIESDRDLDIIIFSPEEWEEKKNNQASFAGIINRTGVRLYG